MRIDEESYRAIVVCWAVAVIIILGVLLPFTVNIPSLPALFFHAVAERQNGPPVVSFSGGPGGTANSDGILVYYDFDGNPAGSAGFPDRSGNGNPAFINGVFVGRGAGIVGNGSLALPGTGYVYAEEDPVSGQTNVTITLWFTDPDPGHNYRLTGGMAPDGTRPGWSIGTRSSELFDRDGEPIRVRQLGRPPLSLPFAGNGPDFKALVYNGSFVTEYLNGNPIGIFTASGKPIGPDRYLAIGGWEPFGLNYAGRIDDFRVYGRALTPGELANVSAGLPASGRA